MSLFRTVTPPYDKGADARAIAEAALSTFEGVLSDLEQSSRLLREVEVEKQTEANVAQAAAESALRDRLYHDTVARRIRALLGEADAPEGDVLA